MPSSQWTAALENLLVRELLQTWHYYNRAYFRGRLERPPTFRIVDTASTLGVWHAGTREIRISRPVILAEPWGVVLEVLKHEIAHQYVHEVLGIRDESAHGPAFQKVCQTLKIDARATGRPSAGTPHDEEGTRVYDRISKLLALAESSNQHEAEAAMAAAQKLMLRYNVEAAQTAGRVYGFRHVGEPKGRIFESERIVAMILGTYFFVEALWVKVYVPLQGRSLSVLEVCGSESNLAMAEYVHGFLHHTAERLWLEHKSRTKCVGDKERKTFLAGVMAGFAEKLESQKRAHAQTGLVWVRDGNLHGYYRSRHPHVRTVRSVGERRSDAYAHGRDAGRGIVIHKPVSGGAEHRGNLLRG